MLSASEVASRAFQPPTKREIYTTMSGLVIAMLLAMLDNLIVGTAMPTIVGDLGGLAHLSWVVTAYTLTTAVSTPLWAKLGDLYGRKGIFMASITVFLIGSALSGLSQSMSQLIGFRAIQGLGAGGLIVGAMAIMGDLVPPLERGRYQGLLIAVMPVAFIGGPLLGGYLTDYLNWRWAFYINLPLGIVALIVIWITMHLPRLHDRAPVIDWAGAALLAIGVTALTLIASWGGGQYSWASIQMIAMGLLAALATIALIHVERKAREPVLPLGLFRDRNFVAAIALNFIAGASLFSAVTFLPQFQQIVQEASASRSGLLLLPMMVGTLITSIVGGGLITRTKRYRWLLLIGSLMMACAFGLLATMTVLTSRTSSAYFMFLLGAGMGCLMQTSMIVVQNSVTSRDLGAATGAATLFRTIGGSLGVSLLGALYASRIEQSLAAQLGQEAGRKATTGRLSPAIVEKLPPAVHGAIQAAVAHAIDGVFFWSALIAVLAVCSAIAIREIPLRGFVSPDKVSPAIEI
jgi:EmrB/QacA subfamily drug resistance transporter